MSGKASPQKKVRLDYIDNLRWSMIFLVIGVHTAVTYGHIGSWYYNEPRPVDVASSVAFLTFQAHTQAFFMGFLFLLAGYFVPGAVDRKGPLRFVADRFVRLGLPSLLYIFAIHPLMGHFLLHWHKESFWPAYSYYVLHWDWLGGSGPMWFAVALLFFSLVYAGVRLVVPAKKDAPQTSPKLSGLIAVGLGIAVAAFLIRTVQPIGTNIYNMQLCFFAQYIVLFALGIVAYRRNWLANLSTRLGYGLLAAAIVLSPLAWSALLVYGGAFQLGFTPYEGGWRWQSAGYALWESLLCVAMCAGLLVLYRERFNAKGKIAKVLSDNSFGIYVFHPPVLVAISLALGSLALPPLEKFAIVWPITFLATLAVVHLVVRRVPGLKRII